MGRGRGQPAEVGAGPFAGPIGGVTVRGDWYVVYGPARGFVSRHDSRRAAEAAFRREHAGARSDAALFGWDGRGWVPLDYVPEDRQSRKSETPTKPPRPD